MFRKIYLLYGFLVLSAAGFAEYRGWSLDENRRLLLEKDWNYWKEAILRDLERVHSNVRQCVSRMDIMRMGHAMVRPTVGSVFSEARQRLKRKEGRIVFANSDLSGISIFEEAQFHGVEAAQKILSKVGRQRIRPASS